MSEEKWMECSVCGALVFEDDEVCCVCHSPLKGRLRRPTHMIQIPAPH